MAITKIKVENLTVFEEMEMDIDVIPQEKAQKLKLTN